MTTLVATPQSKPYSSNPRRSSILAALKEKNVVLSSIMSSDFMKKKILRRSKPEYRHSESLSVAQSIDFSSCLIKTNKAAPKPQSSFALSEEEGVLTTSSSQTKLSPNEE